jgi:hypothetical protein
MVKPYTVTKHKSTRYRFGDSGFGYAAPHKYSYIRIPILVFQASMTGELTLRKAFRLYDIGQISRHRVPTPVFVIAVAKDIPLDKAYLEYNSLTGYVSFPYIIETYRIAAQKDISPEDANDIINKIRQTSSIPFDPTKKRRRGRPKGAQNGNPRRFSYGPDSDPLSVKQEISSKTEGSRRITLTETDINLAIAALAKFPYQIGVKEAKELYKTDPEFRNTVHQFAREAKRKRKQPSASEKDAIKKLAHDQNKSYSELEAKWKSNPTFRKTITKRLPKHQQVHDGFKLENPKYEHAIQKLQKSAQQKKLGKYHIDAETVEL